MMMDFKLVMKLPRYYRYLKEQLELGSKYASSGTLGKLMGISPSQIRQDFNRLLFNGYHGVGYDIVGLLQKIEEILDLKTPKNLIIIGAGNLGQTLCNNQYLAFCGFTIKALFDVNPRLVGLVIKGLKVYDVGELESYIIRENITAAILSVPSDANVMMIRELYSFGVKTFLNFNTITCDLPEDIAIENVHIDDHLMMLSYKNKILKYTE